jgi:hypothetical protein
LALSFRHKYSAIVRGEGVGTSISRRTSSSGTRDADGVIRPPCLDHAFLAASIIPQTLLLKASAGLGRPRWCHFGMPSKGLSCRGPQRVSSPWRPAVPSKWDLPTPGNTP